MKAVLSLHGFSAAKQLAFAALFAALCFVGTLVVQIPAPLGGYLNIGDVFVLLAGWCLGPLYGGVAAAVGSALADIVAFPIYAPATFLIKGLDAVAAYGLWLAFKKLFRSDKADMLCRLLGAAGGELIMLTGYALFDYMLSGMGAAVANLPFNGIQAGLCIIGGCLLVGLLNKSAYVKKTFPALDRRHG